MGPVSGDAADAVATQRVTRASRANRKRVGTGTSGPQGGAARSVANMRVSAWSSGVARRVGPGIAVFLVWRSRQPARQSMAQQRLRHQNGCFQWTCDRLQNSRKLARSCRMTGQGKFRLKEPEVPGAARSLDTGIASYNPCVLRLATLRGC